MARFSTQNRGFHLRRRVRGCLNCTYYTEEEWPRVCPECESEKYETFDSYQEFLRFAELRLLQSAGKIRDLELHPRIKIFVYGQNAKPAKGCTIVPDFQYFDSKGQRIVEDVKPKDPRVQTDVFKLKCRLFKAAHGFEITIIPRG